MAFPGIDNLNLKVDVAVYALDRNKLDSSSARVYKGTISGREQDNTIVIQMTAESDSNLFTEGKPIFLFLAHDLGLYIFSATVHRSEQNNDMVLLHCGEINELNYFQRRRSVRVNVSIPVSFSDERNKSRVFEGTVINLSTGGLQLQTASGLPAGNIVEMVYELENIGPLFIDGKVVRVMQKEGLFYHGIHFLNPDRYTLDGIARFIMAEQLRQKKLGLQVFKAFLFEAAMELQAPAGFSIIQYKDLDISALKNKRCYGTIVEIGLHGLAVECLLNIPPASRLEFSVELPGIGYSIVQAIVQKVESRAGKYLLQANFCSNYENIRNCILSQMASNFNLPFNGFDNNLNGD
ncbi:MAG: PilZ domain-containing protein [Nitrospiraceae bacterium]|nr:MAG: PilZ domain-containing protein [Nitrospiraceae bacterium]